ALKPLAPGIRLRAPRACPSWCCRSRRRRSRTSRRAAPSWGRARLVFGKGGAKTMEFFGKYIEVTPHSRIVWTNDESGEDGAITTVTLEEKGDKTLLALHEL